MAIGNIVYSTSSTTITAGGVIDASDFERSTNLQVDNTSGNLNIAGGINTGGTSNLGSVSSVKISGGSSGQVLTTDGSSNLSFTTVETGGLSFASNTSSGTFTIPAGVTKVKVTIVGGGGGGGAAFGDSGCGQPGGGGGGGSGSTAYKWLTGLTPGNTIGVTVGGGGTAGSGGAGGTGGSSSIQSGTQTITTVTALGGLGGGYGNQAEGTAGQGQTPTNGDINITGDDGNHFSEGGKNSLFGSRNYQSFNAHGLAANLYGNGGNGGRVAGGSVNGGAGAAGIVIFEW